MNLGADGKPVVTALPTEHKCPKCEKQNLLLKESKAGKKFVQCPDAKCKFIADVDAEGNPVKPAGHGHQLREVRQADGGQGERGAGRSCRAAATRSAATRSRSTPSCGRS